MIGVENEGCHPEWDGFVLRTPGGDLDQSTPWACFRNAMGFDCHRIVAREQDTIVGGMQVYVHRAGPWKVAYVPYGPLVAPDAAECVVAELVQALRCDVSRRGAVFVQPPMHGEGVAEALSTCGFASCETHVAPSASLRLDLSRPIEEIEHGLSHQIRPFVQRWDEMGVRVRPGTRDDLGLLADLHAR